MKEWATYAIKLSSVEITLATDKLQPSTLSIVLTLYQQQYKFH